MPMDLLHQLAHAEIPATVTGPAAIYNLHVLRAAGHVYATIPSPHLDCDGHWQQAPATVHLVTALGYKVLRYFGPDRPEQGFEKDHDRVQGPPQDKPIVD